MAGGANPRQQLIYQVDEDAPRRLIVGVGLQYALLSLSSMMLMPAVAFRAGGASEAMLGWAVFAAMVVSGAVTALHARPLGRFGAGYVLTVAPASAAVAVTADALNAGGVALLALLTATASGVQFLFSWRMSLLRRVLTPTVSGTALMLIPVTIIPVALGLADDVPAGYPDAAAPACAGAAILVIGGILLLGTPRLRVWAPIAGLVAGSSVAAYFGLYDFDRVAEATWFGLPTQGPSHYAALADGVDIEAFAGLLPAFLLLFLICTVRSTSSSLAIQTVSWRERRALDFRPVQGTIAADGLANMAAAVGGTMPTTAHSGTASRTLMTGIAARPVGLVYGTALILLAFCPKVVAVVLALPAPVFAGYLTVMVANVFIIGLRMAVAEAADHRQGLIVGLSFWMGVGCQYGFIFPDFVATFAGGMLKSALTTGGLIAIGLTGLLLATAPRRQRLETQLATAALPALRDFVQRLAERYGWSPAMARRLDAVSEEALLTLLQDEQDPPDRNRRLLVAAHTEGGSAVVEFIAAGGQENIEDRLAVLGEATTSEAAERDVSLRLLRHLAAEVSHRQYHDVDVLTLRVAVPS